MNIIKRIKAKEQIIRAMEDFKNAEDKYVKLTQYYGGRHDDSLYRGLMLLSHNKFMSIQ